MSEYDQPTPMRFALSRRQVVVGAACLAGAGIRATRSPAQTTPYRFRQGDFEITVLSDGHLVLPATIHGLDAPREEVHRLLQEAGLDPDQVKPATNPALIRTRSDLILLDTGSGANFQGTAGKLLDNLKAANIDPKSITKVVFTHAHPDHIWGTIGAGGALNFPNAAYYVSAAEWDFWMDPHLTTKLPEQMHVFVTGAQTNLAAVKDRVTMVKPGDDIVTGLSVLDSSGHTPGHISLVLAGSEGLLIPAGAITEPAVYFPHPEWQFAYDMDNGTAVANRKKLLDRAATDKMKMLGFHWPYPGLGLAERKGTGYQYVPAA
ncbi:MBL fold metallo-hydrolase [Bradyrhizobium sp. 31Argb]|uniref:MBL fold metallo-hydrolase n=1 Tax=Bradyrhizobium sp. 31Argb TaxID=3141247 RepID=UPI003748CAC6